MTFDFILSRWGLTPRSRTLRCAKGGAFGQTSQGHPIGATLHLPVTRGIKVVRTTEWGNPRRTKRLAAFGFTGHRPPAALPSRSAIARPRLSGRLPLGSLALFPPLRPGRFVNDRPSRLFSAQQEALQRSLGWNWLFRLTVAEFGCRDAGRSMKCHPLEGVLRSLTPSFALRSGSTARTVGYSPGPCPRTPRSAGSTTSAISED